MHSRTSTLTALTLLLTACGISDSTTTDTAPVDEAPDAGPSATTEDLTVFVYEPIDGESVPLEGAVVGLSQDGVVSVLESDADGRAAFAVNPDGGPVMVSAYLSDYAATSVVYDYAAIREDENGVLPLYMEPTSADVIYVSGEFEPPGPNMVQMVVAGTSISDSRNAGARFRLPTARGEPFLLTAYLQTQGPAVTPSSGMLWPMASFRTLIHEGSVSDIDVTDATWREHDIADYTVRVARPTAPASLADDQAILRMTAQGKDSDMAAVLADTTALEPWVGKESYTATMSGRADLMASADLTVLATLYAADRERTSTIRLQGTLPTSIDGPFLPPPEITTDAPRLDQQLAWDPGDASLWTFLVARGGSLSWSVTVMPGVRSIDLPALLATLPTAPVRGRELSAWLTTCDSNGTYCTRSAASATFTIRHHE